MFKPVAFYLFNVDELLTFYRKVRSYIDNLDIDKLKVKKFVVEFSENLHLAGLGAHQNHSSALTSVMNKQEDARDKALLAYRSYIEACSRHHDPEWGRNGYLLVFLYRRYGWSFHSLGHKLHTVNFEAMKSNLEDKKKYAEALKFVQAESWWNAAVNAHEAYIALERKRDAERVTDLNNKAVYQKLRKSYRELINVLDVIYTLKEYPEIKELADKINFISGKYMANVKSRQTRRENAKKEIECSSLN